MYESFELLLGELGIQIEFDSEEEGIQDITRDLNADTQAEIENAAIFGQWDGSRKASRRASFNSMYDVEDGSLGASQSRPVSRASTSRFWDTKRLQNKPRSSWRVKPRPTERVPFQPLQAQSNAIQQLGSRLTAQEAGGKIQSYPKRRASPSSSIDYAAKEQAFSNHISGSRTAKPQTAASDDLSLTEANPGNNAQGSSPTQDTKLSSNVAQLEVLNRPSRTQLLRDADTFEHYRIRSVARKWLVDAVQIIQHRNLLVQQALSHDADRLLRESVEHWQQILRLKRHTIETEGFFSRLELRAGKARDLYLLSKAFTHWAECAYEVAINTSTARRHLLRLKFFNAWVEITAVNALKARRLCLKKFFTIWQQGYTRVVTNETTAALVYQGNLHRLGYWCWFWTFCGKRAPQWRAARLRNRYFSKWVCVSRDISQRNYQVRTNFNEKVTRRILEEWCAKARVFLSQSLEATESNHQKTKAHLLWKWRLKTYRAPLARQVSNMVDWRVAGSTFAIFVSRYRVERQAEEINRLRLMRNAWTQWNDRLRWQTLSQQIDSRVVVEALYRWVLAERYALLQRLYEERLKLRNLAKLVNCSYNIQAQRNNVLRAFDHGTDRRCLQLTMVRWRQRLALSSQDNEIAFHFSAPRAAQESLKKWIFKIGHLQRLNGWSKDADFYFITSRTLKRWQFAATESKRLKRRDAYIQIRRKSKMHLATKYLACWRGRTARSLAMQETAQQINRDRLFQYGTSLFDEWRTRVIHYSDWTYQAEDNYALGLTSRHLHLWRQSLQAQVDSEELARLFFEPHLSSIASSCLHKCRLRMIEFKAIASKAESFKRTYDKRHIRRHIRQWHEKTAARRTFQPTPDRTATSSKAKRLVLQAEADAGDEGATTRAEEWTALDLGEWIPALEVQGSTAPLPGYLSTPSKRAARARALARASTTPIGTPFGRRLGPPEIAQPKTETSTRKRVAFGRSTTGAALGSSIFGAIMEDEPPKTLGGLL